jgi:hypothetical protein
MMPAVVGDIVAAVINELSQVPGVSTQVYSGGRILQFVQNALQMEMEEMWWPDYMCWLGPIGVDGVTGSLTSDLRGPISTIDDYGDIYGVWPSNSNKRLAEAPRNLNPQTLSGTGKLYMMADYKVPHRPFIVWPPTSTGDVMVRARQRNVLPMTTNDTVYLDALLLQYDAAWMYAIDDGSVPAQANKFEGLATKRRTMMKSKYANQPLTLDPRFPEGTDQWWAVP